MSFFLPHYIITTTLYVTTTLPVTLRSRELAPTAVVVVAPITQIPLRQHERHILALARLQRHLLEPPQLPDRCSRWRGRGQGDVELRYFLAEYGARVLDCRCDVEDGREEGEVG